MSVDKNALLESLLEEPCLIIDVMPERVPKDSSTFWEVEDLLLEDKDEMELLASKFRRIVLKLACYFGFEAFDTARGEWQEDGSADELSESIVEVVEGGVGGIAVLFPSEECLLFVEGGSLNMTAHGTNKRFRELLAKLAKSEGLFCWEGLQN